MPSYAWPFTGAIMTPIINLYLCAKAPVSTGYEYARSRTLPRCAGTALAVIENGKFGLAFSSGLLLRMLLKLLHQWWSNAAMTVRRNISFIYQVFEKFGIKFIYVIPRIYHVELPFRHTKLIWIETPTNPLMNITDIAAVAASAKSQCAALRRQHLCIALPAKPTRLWADIVMHSPLILGDTVMYSGRPGDDDAALREQWYFIESCGAVPGPMDLFPGAARIKTLHVPCSVMWKWCSRCSYLRNHSAVGKVYWPVFDDMQLPVCPQPMRDFGALITLLKDENHCNRQSIILHKNFHSLKALAEWSRSSSSGFNDPCFHPSWRAH